MLGRNAQRLMDVNKGLIVLDVAVKTNEVMSRGNSKNPERL